MILLQREIMGEGKAFHAGQYERIIYDSFVRRTSVRRFGY